MELKDFYLSKAEVEKALETYNSTKPRDQWLFYTTSFDSYRNRWLYIPCTEEFFHMMRNLKREEMRELDEESRCLVPSERGGYKKCREDCDECPYGKLKRDGKPLSLDYSYENEGGDTFSMEIADETWVFYKNY